MTDDKKREPAADADADEKSSKQAEVQDLEVGPDDAERVAGGKATMPSEHAM
jgi:hypothetical protein